MYNILRLFNNLLCMMLNDSQRHLFQTKGVMVGRVLLGLLFLVSGLNILTSPGGTAAYFSSVGIPMAEIVVWLVVIWKVGASGALILNKRVGLAAAALIVFTLLATLIGHMGDMTGSLKNLAIVGGLLYVIAYGGSGKTSKPSAVPSESSAM